MRMSTRFALLAAGLVASSTFAGSISAKYDIPFNPGTNANFSLYGDSTSVIAVRINGLRQDTPGSGGADDTIGMSFPSFCVEIGVPINTSTGGVFDGPTLNAEVYSLGGSTTTGGVFFDLTRTDRLERLWGTFFDDTMTNTDATYSAAFQVAVWKIAFENTPGDLDLFDSAQDMYFSSATAISNLAQSWLDVINAGGGTSVELALIKSANKQDLITVVPAPGALALLGLAGFVSRRRRR